MLAIGEPPVGDAAVTDARVRESEVDVPAGSTVLRGILGLPERARGVVVFAHGSGSGRFSPRNNAVARALQGAGLATLLVDLLTEEEAQERRLVFEISLLASRLLDCTRWLTDEERTGSLPLGYFGASTGAGAALVAAARSEGAVRAVVSRGGRPDLADSFLSTVRCPTLLVVGGRDEVVIGLNQQALRQLSCTKELVIVPGATHLFEEPGALEEVSRLACDWFSKYLAGDRTG